jgi:YHS domain-containing protein
MRRVLLAVLTLAVGCTLNDRLCESVHDPVCGSVVGKAKAAATRSFLRKTYYFDSDACALRFEAHPARCCDVASTMYPEYDY